MHGRLVSLIDRLRHRRAIRERYQPQRQSGLVVPTLRGWPVAPPRRR